MGAKSSLTMSWCTDQATVNLSKLRTLYDETREGLTGRFPKCTLAERVSHRDKHPCQFSVVPLQFAI